MSDVLTALFVDEFYAHIAGVKGGIDLARALHDVQHRLRNMDRETAVSRLGEIGQRIDDVLVNFELDTAAQTLASGEPTPFAHPLQWASFHVMGRGEISMGQEGRW